MALKKRARVIILLGEKAEVAEVQTSADFFCFLEELPGKEDHAPASNSINQLHIPV